MYIGRKNVRICTDFFTDGMYGNVRIFFENLVATLKIYTGWPLCTDVRKCTDMYGFPKKCQKMYGLYGFFYVCTEMYGFHVKSLKIVILANCHIVVINVLACML